MVWAKLREWLFLARTKLKIISRQKPTQQVRGGKGLTIPRIEGAIGGCKSCYAVQLYLWAYIFFVYWWYSLQEDISAYPASLGWQAEIRTVELPYGRQANQWATPYVYTSKVAGFKQHDNGWASLVYKAISQRSQQCCGLGSSGFASLCYIRPFDLEICTIIINGPIAPNYLISAFFSCLCNSSQRLANGYPTPTSVTLIPNGKSNGSEACIRTYRRIRRGWSTEDVKMQGCGSASL